MLGDEGSGIDGLDGAQGGIDAEVTTTGEADVEGLDGEDVFAGGEVGGGGSSEDEGDGGAAFMGAGGDVVEGGIAGDVAACDFRSIESGDEAIVVVDDEFEVTEGAWGGDGEGLAEEHGAIGAAHIGEFLA